jgi:hypothetical protein
MRRGFKREKQAMTTMAMNTTDLVAAEWEAAHLFRDALTAEYRRILV